MAKVPLTPTGIRTDLVERLTGKTAAGQRVFDSRRVNLDETDDVPAVVVYSLGGREEKVAANTPTYRRTEQVGISAVVKGADDTGLAAAVDAAETAILEALNGDMEWLCSFERVPSVTSKKTLTLEGDHRLGAVVLQIEVQYTVRYRPVTTGLELQRVAVTTDSETPAGANVSERVLEVGA